MVHYSSFKWPRTIVSVKNNFHLFAEKSSLIHNHFGGHNGLFLVSRHHLGL